MKNSGEIVEETNKKYPIGKEVKIFFANKIINTKIKSKAKYLWCGTLAIGVEYNDMLINFKRIQEDE